MDVEIWSIANGIARVRNDQQRRDIRMTHERLTYCFKTVINMHPIRNITTSPERRRNRH